MNNNQGSNSNDFDALNAYLTTNTGNGLMDSQGSAGGNGGGGGHATKTSATLTDAKDDQ